jgi:hypothetical protein
MNRAWFLAIPIVLLPYRTGNIEREAIAVPKELDAVAMSVTDGCRLALFDDPMTETLVDYVEILSGCSNKPGIYRPHEISEADGAIKTAMDGARIRTAYLRAKKAL